MGSDAGAEEQFGPYVVYERLGLGGMASVHRALERGLDGFERIVALKRLLPHLAADASFIKSFVREAKLASLLSHINIVQIFECGRVGTQYFISMEYIDGRDIRRILRHARKASGPPPIHVTVGLLLQLCDALDYAHGKADEHGHPLGLVHRDVSPSNLLVTSEGRVKVIDFGIAKAQSAQLRTQTGRVKGKLAYMAPEALVGKELDARTDLFAAGIIAHELLTARPLFASKNDYQTLMKVQRGEIVPPSTFNPGCPPELDAIVLRALARELDDRFAHASELRDELNALRRQYKLQTTERDVVAWLDWAFARPPTMTDVDARPAPQPPPETHETHQAPERNEPPSRPSRLRRTEDDEVVELAWGVDEHGNGEPIVLDDVPDVSDKHLPSPSALGAEVRLDLDDLADDIPTPLPTHGARSASEASARAVAAALFAPPAPRVKRPTPTLPNRGAGVPVAAARELSRGVSVAAAQDAVVASASASTSSGPVRTGMRPPRARTMTIPPRVVPSGTTPPRSLAIGSESCDPIARAAPGAWPFDRVPPSRDAGPDAAQTVVSIPAFVGAEPSPRGDGPAADPTPSFHADELGLAADTIPSMPAMQTSEPIVRFREPTGPPPMSRPPEPPAQPTAMPAMTTKLGLGPMAAPPLPVAPMGPLPVTPATALFAEADPEPDTESSVTPVVATTTNTLQRTSSSVVAPDVRARRPLAAWRVVVMLVALAVVAAAVTAGALYLLERRRAVAETSPPPPPAPRGSSTGTVQLSVEPNGAEIAIDGEPLRAGAPWAAELAPGTHQVEIHHAGYKGWLTSIDLAAGEMRHLQVTLDPLGAGVSDATLVIVSSPPALDVVLDGVPAGIKTPIKVPIQPGPHTVALRIGGVEIWRKSLDARASAVYELTPTIAPRPIPVPAPDVPPPELPPVVQERNAAGPPAGDP